MRCEHTDTSTMTRGPFGLDAPRGRTMPYDRTVLVVAHTVTSATRLGDVVPLLETDPRIQVVYTQAPDALFSGGAREFLGRLHGVVLPWEVAVRTQFDLALAAKAGSLEWLHAPVVRFPHGTGYSKYQTRWDLGGPAAAREPSGPDRARLVYHGGVVAAAHIVPTRTQAERLLRSVPEAAPVTVVAGDPCYDRLEASLPERTAYRKALNVGGRKLITVTSTWSPNGLLGTHPGLLGELIDGLPPADYQVAAIVHPTVWHWHGPRQMKAWYADCIRRGMILIPPEEGWRATIAASDVVIGDQGSVTCYAAAAGIPVLLGTYPAAEIEPGSTVARLATIAPRLVTGVPYDQQFENATNSWSAEQHARMRDLITDLPGRAATTIRSCLYRLMGLPEPAGDPRPEPVPAPRPVTLPQTFGGGW
jgi:hypothetical protein